MEQLEYFWGLFDEPDKASARNASKWLEFEESTIPDDVLRSFAEERIVELQGEFGSPGVGEPTEIDCLRVVVDGESIRVRVLNRGISLFIAESDELLRLHRFFCVVQEHAHER